MENLILNLICSLLIVNYYIRRERQMEKLYIRVKKMSRLVILSLIFSSVLFIAPSYAAEASLFGDLTAKGIEIFTGMRDIIYVVAGFGIIGVAIGGFFGNINWKWLGAIVIGLMVIGLTGGILTYIGGSDAPAISDTLK